MEKAVSVHNLHVSYFGNEVIRDVNFSIDPGHLVGVIGPNGAGKSTLMKAVLGLIPKDKGEVEICGKPIDEFRKNIAYVPQRSNIDWNFPIVVEDAVLTGRYPKLGLFHRPKKSDKEWAKKCLKQVGMENFAYKQIGELSGGQQQRVFLARALAQEAQCFFLDEPFVGVDVSSEEIIINILKRLRDEGKTILVVHHDLTKVEDYFDQLVLINKELIGAGPVKQVFQSKLMQKAYKASIPFLNSLEVGV